MRFNGGTECGNRWQGTIWKEHAIPDGRSGRKSDTLKWPSRIYQEVNYHYIIIMHED